MVSTSLRVFGPVDRCSTVSVRTNRFVDPKPSRRGQLEAFPTLARVFLVSLDSPCCSDALAFSQGGTSRGPFAVKGFLTRSQDRSKTGEDLESRGGDVAVSGVTA